MTCACKRHKHADAAKFSFGPRVKIEIDQRSGAIGSAIGATTCGAAFAATGILAWMAPIAAALCGLAGGAIEDAARGTSANTSPEDYRAMLNRTQQNLNRFERREGTDKELSDLLRPAGVKSAILAGALTCGPRARAMLSLMTTPDRIHSISQDTDYNRRASSDGANAQTINNAQNGKYATLW